MPAITVENPLVLPRLAVAGRRRRRAARSTPVVPAHHAVEGAGFEVWRPFPGGVDAHVADPFFLLDQLGPVDYAPNEPVGAPVAPAPWLRDRHLRHRRRRSSTTTPTAAAGSSARATPSG